MSLLRKHFQTYHNIDLVATLAALSVFPPNHGKYLRLEYLTLEALSVKSNNNEKVKSNKLSPFLNKHFGHHHLEDPPENIFTENIINTLGNNIVYGGNFVQGAYILNTLISTIQFNRNSFPINFLQTINDAFLLLLKMSDLVASRLDHKRNMFGEHNLSGNEIKFPSNIIDYKDSLFFSNEWIDAFCKKFNISKDILSYFSLYEDDRSKLKNEIADNNNPLITKPLAQLSTGILVVSPTCIVSSLVHFAWIQSERYNCKTQLIQNFHKKVWEEILLFSSKIKFKLEKFDFEESKNIPIKNALFRFDSDKLAILSFIYDEGEKYNFDTPYHSDPMGKIENALKLQDRNYNLVKNGFKEYKFIELTLYSTIGREHLLKYPKRENSNYFISNVYKFLSWIKCETHDNMSLWYFLEAKRKFIDSLRYTMPTTCILDYYNLYRKNKTFYLGDEKIPNDFFLMGGAINIIKDAIEKEDKIAAYYKVDDIILPVLVPVVKFDDYIPRYFIPNLIGYQLEYYLPGYPIDIWLRVNNSANEGSKNVKNLYYKFSEAISYWFWQVRELLYQHLVPLKLNSLLISYELINIDIFETLENIGIKDNSLANRFTYKIEQDRIEINIPSEIMGHLSSSDNEGERIIFDNILYCFGKILEFNKIENTLSQEVIDEILNAIFPLGLKKMILLINTNNSIALDPRNVNSERLIQESRKQWYMDEVIPLLGDCCPPEGEVYGKREKQELTKNIVKSLLKELRKILKNYNSIDLLFECMKNNEAIQYEKALSRLMTPTRLHCFADQEEIIIEIQKKIEVADETSLANRCLIEHLASEPSFGNSIINQQVLDDVVALMSLIILWGGVGDRIMYDLFDVELAVLPSRRIGTNSRQISELFFKQFSNIRVKEYIEDTIENFSSHFVDEEELMNNPVPNGFNSSFANEVGIRFDKLGGMVNLLVQIGYLQNSSIAKLTIPEIIIEVENHFDVPFTAEEIQSGIRFLSLRNRGDVSNIPEGFKNIDISPWRYNRKLSYLQRPLIWVDYGIDSNYPKVYWTPRHLINSWNYLNHLILSGRYKADEKSNLERQISIITKNRGLVVQEELIIWLNKKTGCFIDKEVEISSKGKLKNRTNIGDIDVFAIDHHKKIIYSIECKRTGQAMNTKQMVEQVEQYFGTGSEMGYFGLHLCRHKWLELNISQIGIVYGFDSSGYAIVSFFVTYEILAIQFMKNRPLPIPMVSLFELRNMSYNQLIDILINDSQR